MSKPKTLCLDRDCGIDPGKAGTLSPNPGANQVRLYRAEDQKAEDVSCLVMFKTLH